MLQHLRHWALVATSFASLPADAVSLPATPGDRDECQDWLLHEQQRRFQELQQLLGEAAQ